MRTEQVASAAGWMGVISYMVQQEVCAFFKDGSTDGEHPWPERMMIKHGIRQRQLQLAVLILKSLQSLGVRDVHPA